MKLYANFLLAKYDVQPHKTRLNILHYGFPIKKLYFSYPSFIPSTSSIILIRKSSGARTESLRP